ncbi:DegT/DnrJ/EryC1/StrS family aminotransferase [Candidatus Micrarchaeota archaeon]|nr:DegT/DnrJ/EryC1/StrS family aminotransferase [Candidatus Micrarchaeota archaeon]
MMKFINQIEPVFDEKEKNAVMAYLNSGGWITEFNKTRELEAMMASYTGSKFCSIVANGTDALIAALLAAEVKSGDEVIVPDYTFVATPNAAELLGAKAVFVDVDRKNFCMDFECMKKAITAKTKAIMLVSINARYPNNIMEFVELCKEKGIILIEDAAQSLGSKVGNKQIGTFGNMGTYSFSSPKIITSGQGGAIVTDNEELFEKIKMIRNFGRVNPNPYSDRYLVKGWNFKFTDIQAVIAMEQLKKLDARVARRKDMGKLYYRLLGELKWLELPETNFNNSALCAFDILCEKRDQLQEFLRQNRIGTRSFYPALHSEPAYNYTGNFPVTEYISKRGLWLPSSNNLINEEISYVCEKIFEFGKTR